MLSPMRTPDRRHRGSTAGLQLAALDAGAVEALLCSPTGSVGAMVNFLGSPLPQLPLFQPSPRRATDSPSRPQASISGLSNLFASPLRTNNVRGASFLENPALQLAAELLSTPCSRRVGAPDEPVADDFLASPPMRQGTGRSTEGAGSARRAPRRAASLDALLDLVGAPPAVAAAAAAAAAATGAPGAAGLLSPSAAVLSPEELDLLALLQVPGRAAPGSTPQVNSASEQQSQTQQQQSNQAQPAAQPASAHPPSRQQRPLRRCLDLGAPPSSSGVEPNGPLLSTAAVAAAFAASLQGTALPEPQFLEPGSPHCHETLLPSPPSLSLVAGEEEGADGSVASYGAPRTVLRTPLFASPGLRVRGARRSAQERGGQREGRGGVGQMLQGLGVEEEPDAGSPAPQDGLCGNQAATAVAASFTPDAGAGTGAGEGQGAYGERQWTEVKGERVHDGDAIGRPLAAGTGSEGRAPTVMPVRVTAARRQVFASPPKQEPEGSLPLMLPLPTLAPAPPPIKTNASAPPVPVSAATLQRLAASGLDLAFSTADGGSISPFAAGSRRAGSAAAGGAATGGSRLFSPEGAGSDVGAAGVAAREAGEEQMDTPASREPADLTANAGLPFFAATPATPAAHMPVLLPEARACSCKKSRCLKLYCECFAAGAYCNGCACRDCSNTEASERQVRAARAKVMQRDANAFAPKLRSDASGSSHRRGCACKKSKCLRKYCECFQHGIPCGPSCKCESCHNGVDAAAEALRAAHAGIRRRAGRGAEATSSIGTPQEPGSSLLLSSAAAATPSSCGQPAITPLASRSAPMGVAALQLMSTVGGASGSPAPSESVATTGMTTATTAAFPMAPATTVAAGGSPASVVKLPAVTPASRLGGGAARALGLRTPLPLDASAAFAPFGTAAGESRLVPLCGKLKLEAAGPAAPEAAEAENSTPVGEGRHGAARVTRRAATAAAAAAGGGGGATTGGVLRHSLPVPEGSFSPVARRLMARVADKEGCAQARLLLQEVVDGQEQAARGQLGAFSQQQQAVQEQQQQEGVAAAAMVGEASPAGQQGGGWEEEVRQTLCMAGAARQQNGGWEAELQGTLGMVEEAGAGGESASNGASQHAVSHDGMGGRSRAAAGSMAPPPPVLRPPNKGPVKQQPQHRQQQQLAAAAASVAGGAQQQDVTTAQQQQQHHQQQHLHHQQQQQQQGAAGAPAPGPLVRLGPGGPCVTLPAAVLAAGASQPAGPGEASGVVIYLSDNAGNTAAYFIPSPAPGALVVEATPVTDVQQAAGAAMMPGGAAVGGVGADGEYSVGGGGGAMLAAPSGAAVGSPARARQLERFGSVVGGGFLSDNEGCSPAGSPAKRHTGSPAKRQTPVKRKAADDDSASENLRMQPGPPRPKPAASEALSSGGCTPHEANRPLGARSRLANTQGYLAPPFQLYPDALADQQQQQEQQRPSNWSNGAGLSNQQVDQSLLSSPPMQQQPTRGLLRFGPGSRMRLGPGCVGGGGGSRCSGQR